MIIKTYSVLFLVVITLGIMSCKEQTPLLPSDYVQWVKDPDNGLVQIKTIKELEFSAQYKPLAFVVAQEERTNTLAKTILEKRKKELGKDYLYYNFRIKNTAGSLSPVGSGAYSDQHYQNRLAYFTFDMQNDVYLLHGQDTFPCTLFQFVRSYDIAPYVEFALGFKKEENTIIDQDLTFVFEDRILGIGTIKLLFDKHIFQNTPTIKTS